MTKTEMLWELAREAKDEKTREIIFNMLTENYASEKNGQNAMAQVVDEVSAQNQTPKAEAPAVQAQPDFTQFGEMVDKFQQAVEKMSTSIDYMRGYSEPKSAQEQAHEAIAELMLSDNFRI